MNYQQAINKSKQKRFLGLIVGVLALISTSISLLKFLYLRIDNDTELGTVLSEPAKNLVSTLYENTSFLNLFWEYSPVPDLLEIADPGNFFFLVVFMFFFVGLALEAAGDKLIDVLTASKNKEHSAGEIEVSLAKDLQVTDVSVFEQHQQLLIMPAITLVIAIGALKVMGF